MHEDVNAKIDVGELSSYFACVIALTMTSSEGGSLELHRTIMIDTIEG